MRASPKLRLGVKIWRRYLTVVLRSRRRALPEYVAELAVPGVAQPRIPIWRLSGAVDRTLRVGRKRPRCLHSALVLFSLLREQGDDAELVIGLPDAGGSPDAHAWVEVGGTDVGPWPGRGTHAEMARFS